MYMYMNKKKNYGIISLLLAIFLAIGSVVYIIWRGISNRAYYEKWKDYDDTGLC